MADNNFDPEVMRRFMDAVANATRELDPKAQKLKAAAEQAEKAKQALDAFGKSVLSSAGMFSKAALNASDTTGKYAGSVEAAGGAVKEFTSHMGFLGKGVGIVVDLFAKLAGGVLKQNEALVKSYRSLSQVGDLGKSFQDIMDNMQDAGFSVDQSAELYTNAIKKAAPGLATFAGTVADGTDALLANQRALMVNEKQFQRYGITQEELFDRTSQFMGILAMSGGKQKLTTNELTKASSQYLENLVQLSMLTGQSRDELEAKMQKDATDLRYQMYLQDQTKDAQMRIQAVMMDLPESLREGAKSILVNQGRIVDDQGAAFFQALGRKGINAMMTAISDRTSEVGVAVGRMQKTHAEILENQFKTFRPTINTGNDAMKDFALAVDTRAYMLRARNFDEEKFTDRLEKLRDDTANAEMDENTTRLQRERRMRNAFEQFEFQMSKFILPVLDAFTESLEALGESMANMAFWFSGGLIDVRDAFKRFKSLNDVTEVLTKEQEKQVKLNKVLESLNKTNIQNEKDIVELEAKKRQGDTSTATQNRLEEAYRNRAEHRSRINEAEGQLATSQKRTSKARTYGDEMAGAKVSGSYTLPENYQQRSFEAKTLADIIRFTGGTGDMEHFRKMDSAAANAFVDMANEYYSLYGDKLQINSAYRSEEEQKNVNSGKNPKAKAGNSLHQIGKALDLNSDQVQSLMASGLLQKYGFSPLRGDPPHIQYGGPPQARDGGIFSGPVTGYNVELHKDEAVVPLNKGVKKQPLSSMSPFSDDREIMEVFENMVDRLETLIDLARRENNVQDEMLTYAKQA